MDWGLRDGETPLMAGNRLRQRIVSLTMDVTRSLGRRLKGKPYVQVCWIHS